MLGIERSEELLRAIEADKRAEDREARQRALKARVRERVAAAQAQLRAELARATNHEGAIQASYHGPNPQALFLSPLSLEERYRLFREAIETTVHERAPAATTLVDKVGDDDAFVSVRCKGVAIEGKIRAALDNPDACGRATAFELCRLLHLRLGREASGR